MVLTPRNIITPPRRDSVSSLMIGPLNSSCSIYPTFGDLRGGALISDKLRVAQRRRAPLCDSRRYTLLRNPQAQVQERQDFDAPWTFVS